MSFEMPSANDASSDGPPSGSYTAVVVDVEQPEFWAFPEPGLSEEELEAKRKWHTRWVFRIENDAEWEGTELRTKRINIQAAGPKANTTKLNSALFGDQYDPNRRYKGSDTIDRRCQIVVKVNERGYSDIVDFLPMRKPRQGTRTVNEAVGQEAFDGMPKTVEEVPF